MNPTKQRKKVIALARRVAALVDADGPETLIASHIAYLVREASKLWPDSLARELGIVLEDMKNQEP